MSERMLMQAVYQPFFVSLFKIKLPEVAEEN